MQSTTGEKIRACLSRNLKIFRQRKKLSQMALANRADLAHNFVNDIENNRKWVSPETLAKLANILEVEPYQFFITDHQEESRQTKIFAGYLDDLTDSFNKFLGEVRNRYITDSSEET
jgi:transcriptional regulator with XRE-family HTH domain